MLPHHANNGMKYDIRSAT